MILRTLALGALCVLSAACATSRVTPAAANFATPRVVRQDANNYTRCIQTGPDSYVLQIACRKMVSPRGQTVDLVGAIHLAEPTYYQRLQRRLDAETLVLYEGVSDKGGPVRKATVKSGSTGYTRVAHSLGLAAQTDIIDYDRKSFRNCDLTMGELRAILLGEMALGGRDGRTARVAKDEFERINRLLEDRSLLFRAALLVIEHNRWGRAWLTLQLVSQTKGNEKSVGGKRLFRLLREQRNEHLLVELRRVRVSERHASIGVFYGADHMPGIEEALHREGYRAGPMEWLDAITAHPHAGGLTDGDIWKILYSK